MHRIQLIGLSLLALTAPCLRAQEPEQPAPRLRRVEAALRGQRDPAAPTPQELALELAADARELRPELLELLHARRIPGAEGEAPQVMSEVQRDLLLELLAQPPLAATRDALRSFLEEHEGPRGHLTALPVLGRVGRAGDLPALLAHAERGLGEVPDRDEQLLLESSLSALLAREPRAASLLPNELAPALLPPVLRGVGASANRGALDFVLQQLEETPGLELLCLAQLQRLGTSGDAALDDAARYTVRNLLDPDEPARCRAACLAAAALLDLEAVPLLIELLAHDVRGVAADARWALCRISGQSFPAQRDLWSLWFEDEQRWRRTHFVPALEALSVADPARVAAAAAGLSEHPLYRNEAAPELAWVLEHGQPASQRLVCLAVGRLRLERLRPLLELLRDEGVEEVQVAATHSLTLLAGRP